MPMFCLKKLISQHWGVQRSPFLEEMALTHYILRYICLGAQSFEHANVLSEKINFSALGGPKVAIFGRDDLDPLYFDVIN